MVSFDIGNRVSHYLRKPEIGRVTFIHRRWIHAQWPDGTKTFGHPEDFIAMPTFQPGDRVSYPGSNLVGRVLHVAGTQAEVAWPGGAQASYSTDRLQMADPEHVRRQVISDRLTDAGARNILAYVQEGCAADDRAAALSDQALAVALLGVTDFGTEAEAILLEAARRLNGGHLPGEATDGR